jgi:5-methylcytosine-specific restriction protein A
MLPFIPNQILRRSEIHDQYGGNRQSGISPSATNPFIFIFSGAQGKKHGYADAWDNPNVFSYTGEGQAGDMNFNKGNLALKDHLQNGKRVFLFEYVQKGVVQFISELEFFDVGYFESPDTSGNMRIAIKFFFKRKGAQLPQYAKQLTFDQFEAKIIAYKTDVPTEKQTLVNTRVGQGAYRKRIIHRWEYQCAVTGFHHQPVLIASHIVPWKHADDDERLDVNNGILLSPIYDALFDKHLISFENSGKIILSDSITETAYKKVGVTGIEKIKRFNSDNIPYLERHRGQLLDINRH